MPIGVELWARELLGGRVHDRPRLAESTPASPNQGLLARVVETGTHRYPCEITDISNRGAKVMTREQLETGSVVRLQIVAPDGAALRVGAVVRRIDADGAAFSFARSSIYHRFIHVA